MSQVDPAYARTQEYFEQLEEIAATGKCPFCPEVMAAKDWHPHPIIRETKSWRFTQIRDNYEHAKRQWILIANRHVTHIDELTAEEFADLWRLLTWATNKFDVKGGGVAMRFGPTNLTGASVSHLHAHLIEPEVNEATGRAIPVNFPFG